MRTSSISTSFDESNAMISTTNNQKIDITNGSSNINGDQQIKMEDNDISTTKKSKKKLSDGTTSTSTGKKKSKKSKKLDAEKENISVVSGVYERVNYVLLLLIVCV